MSRKDKKYIRIKEKRVFWFKVFKMGNTIKNILFKLKNKRTKERGKRNEFNKK